MGEQSHHFKKCQPSKDSRTPVASRIPSHTTHERGIERFSGTGIRSRLRAFLGFDCQLRLRTLAHGMDGGLGFETAVVGEIKPYGVAAVYQSEAVSRLSFHENCAGAVHSRSSSVTVQKRGVFLSAMRSCEFCTIRDEQA